MNIDIISQVRLDKCLSAKACLIFPCREKRRYIYRPYRFSLFPCASCPKIHFYEVEFKLAGMRVMPTHKNCGDALNEDQSTKFEKELIKYWGFEEKKN